MKKILFFDTETTGLNPAQHEVAQLVWQVYSEKGELLTEHNFYLPCRIGNSFKYHGITQAVIDEFSKPHHEVFEYFFESVKGVDLIVCHNCNYNSLVLKGTIEKRKLIKFSFELNNFLIKKNICSMLSTIDFCKLPSTRFNPSYNALSDVQTTAKCFFVLLQKGEIKL